MTRLPPALVPMLVLVAASTAVAQTTFDYPTFTNPAGLTLNGDAVVSTNQLRLTNNGSAQTGSVWRTVPVSVTEGFETRFEFSLTSAPEGMAFVVQGSPAGASALGGSLWGIGYGFGGNTSPISNSLAIEIDCIQDTFLNDTSANEVSIHTTGVFGNSENEGVSIARVTPTTDLSNNAVHTLRVRYVPGTIEVYLNTASTPLLSAPFTFETGGTQLAGGPTGGLGFAGTDAWVGFTSATASGTTNHNATLRSWSWASYQVPNTCYTGNVGAGSGGPYDLLTVNGSNGGFFRTASLQIGSPFTVAVAPPPGVPAAPFVLLGTIGIADGSTAVTTPYGLACFPLVAVIDIGGFVAPQSLAVPPGILLSLPLTLQAVMAGDPGNPTSIQLTNAIALQFSVAPPPAIATVSPNSAVTGGTITLTGTNFSPFATVTVAGSPVQPLTLTATSLTFAMPAGIPCASTVTVRNPDGASATANFNPVPTVTNTIGTSGSSAGGTTYIVLGTGFAPGTTVTIGGNPATVTTAAATVLTAIVPPGAPGQVPVVITTPGGCSPTTNHTFTYL